MQICRDIGGYSYGRADLVRRAMSKKKHEVMENERSAFVHGTDSNCGAAANGVPENIANEIFDEMAGFASYAFNKAHAAAYATVAYQTAYLRCRYYAEYMAALITGQQEKLPDYITDLAAHNKPMLPPNVNKSRAEFTVENGRVRFGLIGIRNLGDNFAADIVREREENGEFKSAVDFVLRMAAYNNNRRYLEALIKSGAMDIFPGSSNNRRELLENIDPLLDYAEREHNRKESGQLDLFEQEDGGAEFVFKKSEDFSRIQCLSMEREYLGAYISGHPADAYLDHAPDDCIFAADLPQMNVGAKVSFIALVTGCNPHVDKKGGLMAFVRLEDSTGEAECVMFSDLCSAVGRPVVGEIYSITGKVTSRNDKKSITALDVRKAEALPQRNGRTLFMNFTSESDTRIPEALKLLSEFPGVSAVRLCFADSRSVKSPGGRIRGVRICTALVRKLSVLMGTENVKTM